MSRALWALPALFLLTTIAQAADPAADEALKKERRKIEGLWRGVTLEIDGKKSPDADARALSILNSPDGKWVLRSDGADVLKGATVFDPTQKPKTIDFTAGDGGNADEQYLGIYELEDNTRRLCFAPKHRGRPTTFATTAGSDQILVTFERDAEDALKRDRRRLEGIWQVVGVEVDGNKAGDDDAKKLKIIFGADGTWSLNSEDREVSQGTSLIAPLKKPSTIDFTVTLGNDVGKQFPGIYEVDEDSLKICAATTGIDHPADFTSPAGKQWILIQLKREPKK